MQYAQGVDPAPSQLGNITVPRHEQEQSAVAGTAALHATGLAPSLLNDLWLAAGGNDCNLTHDQFGTTLATIGTKYNHGLPPDSNPSDLDRAQFYRSLHLSELALAQACALGSEPAWERFVALYRAALIKAGATITGSAALGEELADSIYADIYGLRQVQGERQSPLASYSGRGSLQGWLRATLTQRYRDYTRRTRREVELQDFDRPVCESPSPHGAQLDLLAAAVAKTLVNLPSEDRYLLAAHFLDRQTLLQIARVLRVHEATISRRIKRLVNGIRKQLLRNLIAAGLNKAAAQEALGADPRDLQVNLRTLLQDSQLAAFSYQRDVAQPRKQANDE